jgi:hypothetical protein
MRILYFTVDGRCLPEKTKTPNARLLEMPDGLHPMPNDSVWQDAKRMMEPILVVIDGVRGPIGGTMETKDVSSVLYEIDMDEHAFKKPRISKMWMRALARFVDFFMTKGIYIGIIIFILYMVAQSMLEVA